MVKWYEVIWSDPSLDCRMMSLLGAIVLRMKVPTSGVWITIPETAVPRIESPLREHLLIVYSDETDWQRDAWGVVGYFLVDRLTSRTSTLRWQVAQSHLANTWRTLTIWERVARLHSDHAEESQARSSFHWRTWGRHREIMAIGEAVCFQTCGRTIP